MRKTQTITLGDRVTGKLRPDGTYISFRTYQHFFRKFNGWGMTTSVLMEIRRKGCTQVIVVYDHDNGQTLYKCHPDIFLEKGIIYRYKGRDWQRILPLEHWTQDGAKSDLEIQDFNVVKEAEHTEPYNQFKARMVNYSKLRKAQEEHKTLGNFI